MLFEIIQILAGLVIVYVIFIIASLALASDGASSDGISFLQAIRKHTVILNGVLDSVDSNMRSFATSIAAAGTSRSYMHLPRSINRIGGAQFTYSFWMYLNSQDLHSGYEKRPYHAKQLTSSEGANCTSNVTDISKDYTLFLKGDATPYVYKRNGDVSNTVGRWTVCPQVILRDDGPDLKLVVRLNTLLRVDHEVVVHTNHSTKYHENEALLTLMEGRWTMISVVVLDDIPIDGFERGTLVKVYLNDTLYAQESIKGSIIDNDGDFSFFPDGPLAGKATVKLTSMSHYNYALSDQDIQKRYIARFETKKGADLDLRTDHASFRAQNRTDEYN